MSAGAARRSALVLGGALLLVTLNMRGAILAVAPVLDAIRGDTGMSAAQAGLLVSLPALGFGLFAPVGPALSRRLGIEGALTAAMLLVVVGVAVRVFHPVGALFAGTIVLGLAVGASNVVVPVVIKHYFPERLGLMTGLYLAVMLAGGSLALGGTVPLMHATGLGWRVAIALWGVPALVAAIAWSAAAPRSGRAAEARLERVTGLWRDPLAWQVSGFLGLQSLNYYATTAWLPTILAGHGVSDSAAGLLLALANAVAIPSALIAATLAGRLRAQTWVVVPLVAVTAFGLVGLLVAPIAATPLWMVTLGIGQGGTLGLSLTLVGLRSIDHHHTAPLSGMAQTVGYLLAAVGPLALGAVHDLTGGWSLPLVLLAATTVPELLVGLGAARPRHGGGRGGLGAADAEPELGLTAGR